MSDWKFLNENRAMIANRFVSPLHVSTPDYGFNGLFRFTLDGRNLRCIASDGMGWQHVSVSEEFSPKPLPWEIMCKVKDLFWDAEETVIQFHPKKSEYVNQHSGCLHLWRCTDGREFPLPESIMVGHK